MIRIFRYMLLASVSVLIVMQLFFFQRDVRFYLSGQHFQAGSIVSPINSVLLVRDVFTILTFIGLLITSIFMLLAQEKRWVVYVGGTLFFAGIVGYILTYVF